jgi:hypothetical protein
MSFSARNSSVGLLRLIPMIAVVLAVLLIVPGYAGAHHILQAAYTGDVEGGGTVTFYTSEHEYVLLHPDVGPDEANDVCQIPDLDRCALLFEDVPVCEGSTMIAGANASGVFTGEEWYGVHGFESRPFGEGDFDYHGLFDSPNGAHGTVTHRFCGTHTLNWQATTDSTNPPWIDPCPNPQCDFGFGFGEPPAVVPPADGSSAATKKCKKKRAGKAKAKKRKKCAKKVKKPSV